jgi:hypothetical protein
MKKLALVTVSALLVSTSAFANDDSAVCHIVSSHAQVAAGAAYTPGVDVKGNPVAPADVNATPPMSMPGVVRMPITMDMAQQLAAAPAGTEMKADVGWVEIHGDGKVLFNGQDVTAKTQTLCANVPAHEETPAAEHHAAVKHSGHGKTASKHTPKAKVHEAMEPSDDGAEKAMTAQTPDDKDVPSAPDEDHEMKMAAPAPTPAAPPAMEAPDAPQPPAITNAAPAPSSAEPANPFAADDSPHVPSPPPGANAPSSSTPPAAEPASGDKPGVTWSSDEKGPNDGGSQGQ